MKRVLMVMVLAITMASIMIARSHKQNTAANAPDSLSEVRRAIDRGNAQWAEGWAKGDAALVASVFAEDGVQLARNGRIIKGRQQIMERQKAAMQGVDSGVKVTVTTLEVWLDGGTAYEMGKYKYEYTEKGKAGVDEGRYVTVWKRQRDSSWKLSMDMGVPQD